MLDLAGILFSSIIMFLVILRAVQMDATTPWFRAPKEGPDSSGLRLGQATDEAAGQRKAGPDSPSPTKRWSR